MEELYHMVLLIAIWIAVRVGFLAIFKMLTKHNVIRLALVMIVYSLAIYKYLEEISYIQFSIMGGAQMFWFFVLLIVIETIFCNKLYKDKNGDIYSSRKYTFLSNLVSLILILSVSGFTLYDWISCFMYFFLSLP